MTLGHLLDAAATVWRVPDVDGDRCVHSHLETADCQRCVTACPRSAWVMDDDMLGLDTEACDGCGLCAPVCPEGAVLSDHAPQIRRFNSAEAGFAVCEYGPGEGQAGRMPCIHAIGLQTLLRLYRRGVLRFFISRGDCGSCVRATAETIDLRVEMLNRLLDSRGLQQMLLVRLPAAQWQALRETSEDASQPAMSRRGFLRRATVQAVDRAAHRALSRVSGAPEGEFTPPGRMLPRTQRHQLAFFSPVIDPLDCNGCAACMRLCPHGALAVAAGGDAYDIDADACTGCRLCVDVCDNGAVIVETWVEPGEPRVPLAAGRCMGCGVSFHRPAAQGQPGAYCRICAVTGHHGKLFQVLE